MEKKNIRGQLVNLLKSCMPLLGQSLHFFFASLLKFERPGATELGMQSYVLLINDLFVKPFSMITTLFILKSNLDFIKQPEIEGKQTPSS